MDLSDIYSNNVQVKQSIGMRFTSFSGSPIIQRDPNLMKLELDVFSKLTNVAAENDTPIDNKTQPQKAPAINFVSFEDALKELQNVS
jgi:hypothetical protein